jgi:Phosphotransferase enzyme family
MISGSSSKIRDGPDFGNIPAPSTSASVEPLPRPTSHSMDHKFDGQNPEYIVQVVDSTPPVSEWTRTPSSSITITPLPLHRSKSADNVGSSVLLSSPSCVTIPRIGSSLVHNDVSAEIESSSKGEKSLGGNCFPSDLPFVVPVPRASNLKQAALELRLALSRKLYARINGPAFRVDNRRLLKRHSHVTLTEALTMDFVARHTSVPVPKVYDLFSGRLHGSKDVLHLVMEYVPGVELERLWGRMKEEDRLEIVQQLRGYILELRRLKPPHPGAVESVYSRPCQQQTIRSEPFGPFPSVKEFQKFLGTEYVQTKPSNYPFATAELERTAVREYTTMFTHGDIAPRNIIVRGNKIVAILDWESAGWYPEYWEYTRTYMANNYYHPSFWELFRDKGMDVGYPDELMMDRATASLCFQG